MGAELELRKAMPAPPAPVVTIPIAVCAEDAAEMDGEVWGFMEDLQEQNRSATVTMSLCLLRTQDHAVVVRLLLSGHQGREYCSLQRSQLPCKADAGCLEI